MINGSEGRALFIGSACIDVVIYLDHLPKTEEDIHPEKQVLSLGGCACNAASAARLISENVDFAGVVGSGVFGELAEKLLLERGLKTNIRTDKENGCCYCFVERNGERTFISVHGAEYTFNREWMREIDKKNYDDAKTDDRTFVLNKSAHSVFKVSCRLCLKFCIC